MAIEWKKLAFASEAISGDGVEGRNLRIDQLQISDGTNSGTIKCQLYGGNGHGFNSSSGDTQDNISKDSTVGIFYLSPGGDRLDITVTGNAVGALGFVEKHLSSSEVLTVVRVYNNKLSVTLTKDGVNQDLTSYVDSVSGITYIKIIYITSE